MLSEYFSTWNLIRTSGFLAYFLFTFSISAGLMGRLSAFEKKKPLMMELHKVSGWTGLLTTIFHMTILSLDRYSPYEWKEILIPFISQKEPISSAFGTISFYLFIIIIGVSDFLRKHLGVRIWKKIHFAVIPAWILMLIHGTMIGTDSDLPWASSMYTGSTILVITLIILRYLEGKIKPRTKKHPRTFLPKEHGK